MTDGSLPLTFALVAGVATFFSPCAYPLLPGYVGFYVSQTEGEQASLSGALSRGLVAGIGVLVTFGVLLVAAYWVGHSTLSNIVLFEPIVGAILVVFGLLVVFDRAPSLSIPLPKRRSSVLGFGVFGAGYALAAAGCVAPLFVAVLAQALALPPVSAALVVGTYVGSVVVLMVSLTVATGMGLVASAGRLAAHTGLLERIAGGVMIIAGLGQLYLAIFVLDVI
ncbi:cytochrome c biogenesis CcdA family protein [Natronorubrum tibetense]|uniref:Cytochrome c biogenesis protein transmembrane region n=1 Tax=Natronorubrum tibetense GA33 TaxID=1114856 RepID=L9VSC7_9EURY|nr:cytochrome c biogenesis protein CcdA [Natronorubrum tibetense]ELY39163.1 cytochrome c biogenesis protein transmembrane region [Natronorubrum tibetense GA33]